MIITVGGKKIEVGQIHSKKDNDGNILVTVMVEEYKGCAIVQYPGNSKMYITSVAKAREMWASA